MEADESDRSFLLLAPVVAVVTTIDREHLDQYTSLEDIQDAFIQFVNRVPFYGAAILCLDEPNVQAIIPHVKRPIITYGTSSQADLVISDIKLEGLVSEFTPHLQRRRSRQLPLPHPPGIHNVRNAAAAAAVALYLSVPVELIRDGLAKFAGVGRRFDIKGVANDITVIDDYGHHPVEIRATLEAAKVCKFDRLLVLFQPHRFSRTQHLVGRVLPRLQSRGRSGADRYLSRQRSAHRRHHQRGCWPPPFAKRGTSTCSTFARCRRASSASLRKPAAGDAILTIGAGNVSRASNEILRPLRAEHHGATCALKIKKFSPRCRSSASS